MKKLGATLIDPVNVQDAIAAIVPYYEPGFLPKHFPSVFAAEVAPIDHIVNMAFDHSLVPSGARGVNLRMLAAQPYGPEGKYALNRYLRSGGCEVQDHGGCPGDPDLFRRVGESGQGVRGREHQDARYAGPDRVPA